MNQESRGPAFDAAGDRYEGCVNDKSARSATKALTPEQRSADRRHKGPKAQEPNRRYAEGLNRDQRFLDSLNANQRKNQLD